jgi:hypothetical protein
MKRLILLCISIFFICCGAFAQTASNTSATVSYVLSMGANMISDTTIVCKSSSHYNPATGKTTVTTTCDTTITCKESDGFMDLQYNYNNNSLVNFPNNSTCQPKFTGSGLNGSATQIYNTSVAYNPADQNEYYFVVINSTSRGNTVPNTYVYRWPVSGGCPGTLSPIADFAGQDLLPTFDNNGNAWAVGTSSTNSPYTLTLQEINFSGSVVTSGPVIALNTGSAPNITTLNGDFVFTPSGQMFLVYNNEEFAINYQSYASNPHNITATYVGKLAVPGGDYLVGLAYAGGSMIGAISTGSLTCKPIYDDIDMLTGALSPATYPAGMNSNDNANLTSGIGTAKSLVSVTPTGVANEYSVVYDIYVQDYGNYPTSNVQVTDNLGSINHPQNVKSVTTSFVGTPPPDSYGLKLDGSFDGTTNTNLLLPGGSLPNYPVAQANFTIQVTVILDGIQPGIIYDNFAIATGNGYNGDQLTDTSTNGINPDPNGNSRPDDAGEDVPTPFIIQITAQSAPCAALPQVLFSETFGHGTTLTKTNSAGGTTQYTPTTSVPVATNSFTIANNANKGNTTSSQNWINLTDHTGNANGNMMLVNGDLAQNIVYQTSVTGLCTNLKYSFNAWATNISDTAAIAFCNAVLGYQPPNLEFQMVDASTNIVLADQTTGPILTHSWTSYGMRIALPQEDVSGTILLQVVNVGGGGCGNDFALDDISFGLCDAEPNVVIDGGHAGCLDSSTTLKATLSDSSVFNGPVVYQWQDSIAGSRTGTPWTTLTFADSATYTIPFVTLSTPTYYRVEVATPGNIGKTCSYTSPPFFMQLKTNLSTPINGAGTLTATPGTEGCTPTAVTLKASGFTLGDGAQYLWFDQGCGMDTIQKTATNTITVNPNLTTTYYVMVAGACNATQCALVTVTDACALPTDLLYFHGSYSTGITTLTWEVTDNEKLSGFYVERSVDGANFTIVDSVDASGANGEASYSLPDNVSNIDAGTITYRLVLRLRGGATEQSPIVAINKPLANITGVVVYPNPASTQLTIAINSDQQQQMSYAVISMQGQLLLTGSQALARGQNSVNVNGVQVLPAGAYIVRIQLQDGLIQKKLIIQK